MSDPRDRRQPDLEQRLAEWAHTESAVDEAQLRSNLLERMGGRPRRRAPLVLAAAAAALLAVLIGLESIRTHPARSGASSEVVFAPADNVILVLREGKSPIYVLTEGGKSQGGDQ